MFDDSIKIDLSLIIGDKIHKIPGGNIKNFNLDLFSYGFSGRIGFWIISDSSPDELFATFVKPDIIEVQISVSGVYNLPSPPPLPLKVKGIVTDKSIREEIYDEVLNNPVLQRYYELSFTDAPKALWTQHFPSQLYVEKSMKDILEANAVEGITLDMDFDALSKQYPMLCLGLKNFNEEASFFDFLIWYMKSNNGVCIYDYKNQKFCLYEKKPVDTDSVLLRFNEVKDLFISIPETIRHNTQILNVSVNSEKPIEVNQKQAVSGIYRGVLVRSEITKDIETLTGLEQTRLKLREHELELNFNQFPAVTFMPGSSVAFDQPEWEGWTFIKKKKYRVHEIHITANAKDQGTAKDHNAPFTAYTIGMTAKLEYMDNPVAFFPDFKKPLYPIRVEGKIVSQAGKATDKTYQIFSDETTSQDFYSVFVPLWNCKIMVPFTPDITTGHFFFPAFTEARVLLNIFYDNAEIVDYLDWGDGTKLPMDSQGNHILFGKNNESKTSIKYTYKDNKPLFSLQRVFGVDTELIQMEDGGIMLQTKEDDSLKAIDETFDVTPQVANANAQLAMDKSAATSEVVGSFDSTKAKTNAKIDTAVTETRAELDEMDSEISAKSEEVNSEINAAMQKLQQTEDKLKNSSATIKTQLMDNSTL
ncbi:MAG: hypothetical protein GY710_21605 [Desulfobacteraceae bacterium]|nr:hypothetical protein [Desulfobacteraceae bacterium]